jgi:phospholipid/cholesterol/gamma-HCH transport system ATP-binding protein
MNASKENTAVAAIEFCHVSLSFDDKPVLEDVSFTLHNGQMIAITGNSASGKTVLLHLAIGLLQPTSGHILINGLAIDGLAESELLELRSNIMGIAFQEDTLFTGLSVFENAAYRLYEHGWNGEEAERATIEILRFVGLEEDAEKLPEELSIGMRRRLEIARALVGWPAIMLFDEPTSGLDPINSRMVLDLIIRARDIHHISALVVTKELHQIPYLANHYALQQGSETVSIERGVLPGAPELQVCLLDSGRVAFFGTDSDFETSTLAAVTQFKNPQSSARPSEGFDEDPWKSVHRGTPFHG